MILFKYQGGGMKKVLFISILSIFIALYSAFLFILPNFIDLNKHSMQISQALEEATGLGFDVEGLKLTTHWNLAVGASIKKLDVKYPKGEKFAQINGFKVKLKLLPLLWRNIAICKIDADKVFANLEVDNNGDFLFKKHLIKKSPAIIAPEMPEISAKKYRISLINGQNNYTLKGENLKISDFILNKKINAKTKGEIILNKRKQISYNIAVFSEVFPDSNSDKGKKTNVLKIFEDLYKYNIKADISTDLAIKNKKNATDIEGKISLDKISFVFGDKLFPASSLKLDFKGDKAKINSSLHIDKNSKAIISGVFRNGKKKSVNLQVLTDEIDIDDLLQIAKALSKPLGLKKLDNIDANGHLKADFNLKSDFKQIESDGYLKIKNASVKNTLYNVTLNSINTVVDFSQNSVKIPQTRANINNEPIAIQGTIDKTANADLSVIADNLQLKGILLALGQTKILRENNIYNGTVSLNASLKGRLDKASPQIKISAQNIDLLNNHSKSRIKAASAIINTNKTKGQAQITGVKILPAAPAIISIPSLNLNFDDKTLYLKPTYLFINNIKTNLSGKISHLKTMPVLDSVMISIPNQVSMPIKGYPNSEIVLKGDLILQGDVNKPEIKGGFNIPLISIPSGATTLKNTTLQFDKDINISCPQIQIANSLMNLTAQASNDLLNETGGIVVKNVNFNSNNIDLNIIVPIMRNFAKNKNSNLSFTILNGKSNIKRFKTGNIVANDITSDISMKNNVLYLDNLLGSAYFGDVAGKGSYDFTHRKTCINLQGRGLSADLAIKGLTGKDEDVHGVLDFDSDISISGFSRNAILRSLDGTLNFIISDGKMGMLGKLEHLLYAQNIVSNSFFKASLNLVAKALTVKNTGVYKYMKGKLAFNNGLAKIGYIKTSGPSMSLYISGHLYLPEQLANLIILGRISEDVVKILGPIGDFSVSKAISSIPKIGGVSAGILNQITTNPNYENTSQIPDLFPKTHFQTKEFKVVIDGEIHKQTSVKSFKWISNPQITNPQSPQIYAQPEIEPQPQKPTAEIPEFINRLPDLKN